MSATLAERIDHLFRNQLSPRGREYTYREVAAAVTGRDGATFSPAYLWQLRTGAKDNPTMRHLEALGRFFQVSPSYFFDDELTEFPDTEVRQLVAARRETLRRLALTLLGLSDESLNAVLNLACRLRQLEGLPRPDQPGWRAAVPRLCRSSLTPCGAARGRCRRSRQRPGRRR